MAKRKIPVDSSLTKREKMMEKFLKYLKEKEMEKENTRDDDLGFEINFGAYQPDKKVSVVN